MTEYNMEHVELVDNEFAAYREYMIRANRVTDMVNNIQCVFVALVFFCIGLGTGAVWLGGSI